MAEEIPEGRNPVAMSVDRSLHVLNCFAQSGPSMTLTELSRSLDMPKSTVFRLLNQLTDSGYLVRENRRYRLSLRVFQLGNHHTLCARGGLREVAAPHLAGLFQHTGFSVNLAVLSEDEVVYLDQIRGPRSGPSPVRVGGSMPALTTALGKALLAFAEEKQQRKALASGLVRRTPYSLVAPGLMQEQLVKVRANGVAFDRQESVVGLSCVAAPVLDHDGKALGAISVSGPTLRFRPETAVQLVQRATDLVGRGMAAAARDSGRSSY